MTRDLSKNGQEAKTKQLLEYKRDQDIRLLKNTPFTTCRTHIGFRTEWQKERDRLKVMHRNIVYPDRNILRI